MQQTPARHFFDMSDYFLQIVASALHDNPRFKNGMVVCVCVCACACARARVRSCVLRAGVEKHVVVMMARAVSCIYLSVASGICT